MQQKKKTKKKRELTAGRQNQGLAKQGRAELTNLGGKRMNSTYTSLSLSLSCGTQAGENFSRRLWFATLESKETNKGRGKTRWGLLQGRHGRQRGQRGTHAGSSEFQRQGKLARTPGLGNREKREKEKETAARPEDLNWARAELNAKTNSVSAN